MVDRKSIQGHMIFTSKSLERDFKEDQQATSYAFLESSAGIQFNVYGLLHYKHLL